MPKNSGFTLIELLVVLTILVLMIAGAIASFDFQGHKMKANNFGLMSILGSTYSDIGSYVYTYGSAPSVADCRKDNMCNNIFKTWPPHPADSKQVIYGRDESDIKIFCFAGMAEPFNANKYIVVSNREHYPNLDMCNLTNGETGFKSDCLVDSCVSYP